MDLRQLRYFIAIVEEGSFSRAALSLRVAQPALSLHVRNMEADLGTELLFRTPQGVLPTEAGAILLEHARAIVARFEAARQEIREGDPEPSGEVRLGLPGTISQMLSVPLILATRRRHPKIRLRVAEAMSGFVLEWLRERRVDLALLYSPVEERGLKSDEVLAEELCLFGPAGGVEGVDLPAQGEVALDEACRLPLILPSPGHGLRDLVEARAASAGLGIETVIDVDSYGNIKELVGHGIACSILPANAIAGEVAAERFTSWRISGTGLTRTVHIAQPSDRPATRAVLAVEALCRSTLADLVGSGEWNARLAPETNHDPGDPRATSADEANS